ncbi:MAG: GNAT family N-acetyltransferase [Candidatus Latescibacteria bacterium]|nr:GNAT family N-acetyltransferase [Candidatus Latescibacterota bacterium]
MSDTCEIRTVSDPQAWDEFVRRAAGGTVFSTWAWLQCAQQATGQAFRCLGCYRNGQLVAGLSGVEAQRAGLRRLATPVLTPHGGLLLAPIAGKGPAKAESEWHRAVELLIAHLRQEYHHWALVHAPAVGDMRPFTWAGWEVRVRYTYQMELGNREGLWERLERRTRTVIRKAEGSGFRVQPTEDLDLFRQQYERLYARQGGRMPVGAGVAQGFAEAACQAGLAHGLKVESPEGQVAAVVIFVRGFEGHYAWVAGADPELNHTGATSLLYWKYFEQEQGRFDFVGANIPSIAFFKRGFGGELVPYFAVEGFRDTLVKGLFSGARVLRNL